jgi:hypothetical protein
MHGFHPEEIIVERASLGSPVFQRLRQRLPEVPFKILDNGVAPNGRARLGEASFGAAKKIVVVAEHKGEFLSNCPGRDGQGGCY